MSIKDSFVKFFDSTKKAAVKIGKKNLVIIASIVLIGGAVYLNWLLFAEDAAGYGSADFEIGDTATDNLGDSSYVSANANEGDSYFAITQINRQRARDEAMEVLQLILDSESALQESKDEAVSDIGKIASDIECEANIETLVIAKGFEDCVAVVNDGTANVIVSTDGLLPNEVAQIKEIVYEQAGISPTNIKIIEKS